MELGLCENLGVEEGGGRSLERGGEYYIRYGIVLDMLALCQQSYVVFLCDVQIVLCQTLALLMIKMWGTQGVQAGAAYPSPMVWSATVEPLQRLWQTTCVIMLFFKMVNQQESAREMETGMGKYLSAVSWTPYVQVSLHERDQTTAYEFLCAVISSLIPNSPQVF